MKYIDGNLVKIKGGIICHQVNCMGVMGAGLALQLRNEYQYLFYDYSKFLSDFQIKENALGNILIHDSRDGTIIANLFAQLGFGRTKKHTDYKAFESCLVKLKEEIDSNRMLSDMEVYFPFGIGCGLGGGNWQYINALILKYFPNSTIVRYK